MGDRQVPAKYPAPHRRLSHGAADRQQGAPGAVVGDLYICPAQPGRGAEGLRRRLLGGEACGQRGRAATAFAVGEQAGSQGWGPAQGGLEPRDVSVLSFLDKPTLLITLDDAAGTAWWTRNGVRTPLRRRIAVYVDEPAAMRAAIVAAGPVTPGKAH